MVKCRGNIQNVRELEITFFPEHTLEYLFATEDERGVRENGPNEEDNIKPRLFTDQP